MEFLVEAGAVAGAGRFHCAGRVLACALGRAGVRLDKKEGDGATPAGLLPLRRILFRPDRVSPPRSGLAVLALAPGDGWCDDPAHPDYNRPVRLPHAARCEELWRADGLYDLLAVLGYNDAPPRAGLGSAIFLHVAGSRSAGSGLAPTEGCVALALPDLVEVLALADEGSTLRILP